MEIVRCPSRRYYGKEMLTIVPVVDHAFASNIAYVVFHTVGAASRQCLARYEGPAGIGRQLRGNRNIINNKRYG